MEFRLIESEGFDNDAVLSIRCGGVRRQCQLNAGKTLSFPAPGEEDIKVDVYKPICTTSLERPVKDEAETEVVVRFPTLPGAAAKALKFQVTPQSTPQIFHSSTPFPDSRPQTSQTQTTALPFARLSQLSMFDSTIPGSGRLTPDFKHPQANMLSPEYKTQAAVVEAQSYLESFSVLPVLQDSLCNLLREKPADPFSYLAQVFESRTLRSDEKKVLANVRPPDMSAQTAALRSRIDMLSLENSKLKSEAAELSNHLNGLGFLVPLEMDTSPLEEVVANSTMPFFVPHEGCNEEYQKLCRRLSQLMLENDSTRENVTQLAFSLAKQSTRRASELYQASGPVRSHSSDLLSDDNRGYEPFGMGSRRTSCASFAGRRMSGVGLEYQKQLDAEDAFSLKTNPSFEEEAAEESEDDTAEQLELEKSFKEFERRRKGAVSGEAYGAWNNRRAAFVPPAHEKLPEQTEDILQAFRNCPLFAHIDAAVMEQVVAAMPLSTFAPRRRILVQGEEGDSLFVLIEGTVECYDERSGHKFICRFQKGRIFGELAMLYSQRRSLSVYSGTDAPCVVARLNRSIYHNLIFRHQMRGRERWEECLRQVRVLETLNPEQIAQLTDTLEKREYQPQDKIIQQGEEGDEFFILLSGECAATVMSVGPNGSVDIQEHRRYYEGDLFGERALLKKTTRAATVTALRKTEVLCLSRRKFERMLGPLSLLQKQNYTADPRKSIADFYLLGDQRGPRGSCLLVDPKFEISKVSESKRTEWFSVYRPTSRDAIAKMLSGYAVGKGLNVKGKSAKRGRQSGFVPFLQISNNSDKELLEPAKADARVKLFFWSEADRHRMLLIFEDLLDPITGVHVVGDRVIDYIDLYPNVYGLDIPETVLREVYINRPDITFQPGWETGRKSEPAFMDMNFVSLRSNSEPKIVLYQSDKQDPLNPHGLLIAYAEKKVKPVVSDFDTFLVGSRNMQHAPIPADQCQLEVWALKHTEDILRTPGPGGWTSRWLEVIKKTAAEGFKPKQPKLGYGDAISYRLIDDIVKATKETGAIRHGAECFNYYFPQELDEQYLVVWEGFQETSNDAQTPSGPSSAMTGDQVAKCWEYFDEDELRVFLIERTAEGYTFPLNPVWPVRDVGWYQILEAMMKTEEGQKAVSCYFPEKSGILEKIRQLKAEFPDGFTPYTGCHIGQQQRKSVQLDLDQGERAALLLSNLKAAEGESDDDDDEDEDDDEEGSPTG